jgi:hypothetical protein
MIPVRSIAFLGAVALGSCSLMTGCNKGGSNNSAPAAPTTAANPSTPAIAAAASDFMDAVIKGDTQRASARLTPQAMQRIIASGKQFAPPGLSTATFKVAQIRTPQVDKAYVLCVITDTSNPTAPPRSEEMACIMRRVENEWRVSGIAAWGGPNQEGITTDFETGQTIPIRRDPAMSGTAPPSGNLPTAAPALPPRMATEPASAPPR